MRLIDADKLNIELHACMGIAECFYKGDGINELIEVIYGNVFDAITDAPTIDTVKKHGHCIDRHPWGVYCSECDSELFSNKQKYCHACGAKLDG